jgi:hypothetical protein
MMKKSILILPTFLLMASGTLFAATGLKVDNQSKSDIYVQVDRMDTKKLAKNMDKKLEGWLAIKKGTDLWVDTTARGKRGIYWTVDQKTYYTTPKFSSPDIIVIKEGKSFEITQTALKAVKMEADATTKESVEKDKTETEAKVPEKTDLEKLPEKIQQTAKLPESALKAAKEVFTIIDSLEPLSNALLKETETIKTKQKKLEIKN